MQAIATADFQHGMEQGTGFLWFARQQRDQIAHFQTKFVKRKPLKGHGFERGAQVGHGGREGNGDQLIVRLVEHFCHAQNFVAAWVFTPFFDFGDVGGR